jgi:membrane protein DedA with SNARE-associated domain/rhodanese-related sulfurtransferase
MNEMVAFLAKHGYWILIISVLGRQACLPIPANLLLLAGGALAGMGRLSFVDIIAVSVIAFIAADLTWYEAGRRWGNKTLHFICGSSRNPSSCVGKMTDRFNRSGAKILLISKFIIGLDAVAVPMAGISGTDRPRFLAFDGAGAVVWSCAYTTLGWAFSDQLDRVATYSAKLATLAILGGIAAVCVFVVLKLLRWYRFLREFRLARITPDQLMSKLRGDENVLILDLQGGTKQAQELMAIPGAIRINPHLLQQYKRYRDADLATDREVVLYCSGPSEITSARVALTLHRRGFENVRPLAGGLDAWRKQSFPVTANVEILTPPQGAVFVLHEIFHYPKTHAARLLKTSVVNVDRLLKAARQRIERNHAKSPLLIKYRGSEVSDLRAAAEIPPRPDPQSD